MTGLLVIGVTLILLGFLSWGVDYLDPEVRKKSSTKEEDPDKIAKLERWNVNWSHPEVDDSFYSWDPKREEYREIFGESLIKRSRSPEEGFVHLRGLFLGAAPENRKRLQFLLGVTADGIFGPKTHFAMSNTGSWRYLEEILYPIRKV